MKAVTAGIMYLSLAACSSDSRDVLDAMSKRNVVVLVSHEVELAAEPTEFQPSKPMKVSGSLTSICFVLNDGVSMQDMKVMDRIFADAIGRAEINVALFLSTGDKVIFSRPSFSWSENGVVLKAGELAACAAPPFGLKLPVGAEVSKVEASSVPALSVKGIYWKSERDPSEPLLPSVADGTR